MALLTITSGIGTLGTAGSSGTGGRVTGKFASGGNGTKAGRGTAVGISTLEGNKADFGRVRASATLESMIMDEKVTSTSTKMNDNLLEPIVGASKSMTIAFLINSLCKLCLR